MIKAIHRFLCKYLSLHGFELIEVTYEHEHGRCPHCGLESYVDNVTREVRFT